MSNVDQVHVFLWVLLGLAMGSIVGAEREYRGHEAGIRTTALVCAGAALFGQISHAAGDTRIAAGVVQGIGFLGAGVVFQRGSAVKGVTTAATIWVMAAVGLLIGEQLWLAGILATLTFVVLLELAPLSNWVFTHGSPHTLEIQRERRSAENRPNG